MPSMTPFLLVALLVSAGPALTPAACQSGDEATCAQKCSQADDKACATLGLMYLTGTGVEPSEAKAREVLDKACTRGGAQSCLNRAVLDEVGFGVPKNPSAARTTFEKACEQDQNLFGCFRLASLYSGGHGVAVDMPKAIDLLERACAGNVTSGCLNLARFLRAGTGTTKDLPRARSLFTALCDVGNGTACGELAQMVERGEGGDRDKEASRSLYVKACDSFFFQACLRASELLRDRQTSQPELALAKLLFACDHVHPVACNEAGLLQLEGVSGVKKDEAAAVESFRKACGDGKYAVGCANYGWQLLKGGADVAKGRALLTSACEQKSAFACEKLAQVPVPAPAQATSPAAMSDEERAERRRAKEEARAAEAAESKRRFRVLGCKVDCNKLCRARSPGDECMVRQHKCQKRCEDL